MEIIEVEAPQDPAVPQPASSTQEAKLTIWDFVEPCETSHADKAAVIRSHLEQAVGKVGAVEMLRDAYATSGRDQAGKTQRILFMDGKAIRVRSS